MKQIKFPKVIREGIEGSGVDGWKAELTAGDTERAKESGQAGRPAVMAQGRDDGVRAGSAAASPRPRPSSSLLSIAGYMFRFTPRSVVD
jgi:hypothetical protein